MVHCQSAKQMAPPDQPATWRCLTLDRIPSLTGWLLRPKTHQQAATEYLPEHCRRRFTPSIGTSKISTSPCTVDRWYSPYKAWVLVLAPGTDKNAPALFLFHLVHSWYNNLCYFSIILVATERYLPSYAQINSFFTTLMSFPCVRIDLPFPLFSSHNLTTCFTWWAI
jgi:hypothetical protein